MAAGEGRKEAWRCSGNGFEQVQLCWHVTLSVMLYYPLSSTPPPPPPSTPDFKKCYLRGCDKITYFETLLVLLGFVASHHTKPWDGGVTCSDMGCCSEDRGECSKLDLLSVASGRNERSRSFIFTSLGLGRCWWWDNAHQRSHTKPAQVWQCWLLCSLSLGERISHCTLFHNGRKKIIAL